MLEYWSLGFITPVIHHSTTPVLITPSLHHSISTVTVARQAMATRFEIVLHGENPVALRAAGEEALAEIDRLEAQLSLYRPSSEIAHLNARAASQPVRVTPSLFALLEQTKKLHEESGGVFDITVAPLLKCWGFIGGQGHFPTAEELAIARSQVGMHLVQLNPQDLTVSFSRPRVMLDLGAIGKGYAIECAAEILREAGVTSALIHGGTSTVYAIGRPPDADSWKIAIENPHSKTGFDSVTIQQNGESTSACPPPSILHPPSSISHPQSHIAVVPLKDEALSVSAVWGKSFQSQGRTLGHILDPRTGEPAQGAVLAAVVLVSSTETDALSTALLICGSSGHKSISRLRPGMRTLLVCASTNGFEIDSNNMGRH